MPPAPAAVVVDFDPAAEAKLFLLDLDSLFLAERVGAHGPAGL